MDKYSRQIGAFGIEAMSKLIQLKVCGLGEREGKGEGDEGYTGLGVEDGRTEIFCVRLCLLCSSRGRMSGQRARRGIILSHLALPSLFPDIRPLNLSFPSPSIFRS